MSLARRAVVVTLVVASLAVAGQPAQAVPPSGVVVIWMDGLFARDFLRCRPHPDVFCEIGRDGTLGLLSTRTEYGGRDRAALSASAGATMSSSEKESVTSAGTDFKPPEESPLAGRPLIRVVRPGVEAAPGPIVATRTPEGVDRPAVELKAGDTRGLAKAVDAALRESDIIVVDLSTSRMAAERRDFDHPNWPLRSAEFGDSARMIEAVGESNSFRDIWVVSPVPTADRVDAGIRLGMIAIWTPRLSKSSVMSSGTTRTKGVVSLLDLGSTLWGAVGRGTSLGEGRRIRGHPARYGADVVYKLEGDVIHAALARHPLTRRALILAMGAVIIAAFLVYAGRGRAPPAGLPRTLRGWASILLLAGAAAPVWIYVEGALPTQGVLSASLVIGAAALVTGFIGRATLGATRTVLLICAAAVVIPVVDLLLGTPLAHKSPWAFQIAGGGRFYGVDEGVLGLVLGAHLVAAGIVLDRTRNLKRTLVLTVISFAAVAWILGAPGLGSKFGAPLTAVPAFGVMAMAATSRRFNAKTIALIAAGTIAVTAMMIGVDRIRADDEQSHVARVSEGKTGIPELIQRKVSAQVRITLTTIWSRAILIFAGALLLLRFRRRDAWDRGLWGRPALRAAVLACAVGAALGFVVNDGGVVASAPILLYAAVGVLTPLIDPS